MPRASTQPGDPLPNLRLDPSEWVGTWVSDSGATTLVLRANAEGLMPLPDEDHYKVLGVNERIVGTIAALKAL